MYRKSVSGWLKHLDFILLDLLCLQVCYCCAYFIRFPNATFPYLVEDYRNLALILSLLLLFSGLLSNNYSEILKRGYLMEFGKTLLLGLVLLALTSLFVFSAHISEVYSRLVIYITTGLFVVLDWLLRILYKVFLKKTMKNNLNNSNTVSLLIVADEKVSKQVIKDIKNSVNDYSIKGIALYDSEKYVRTISSIPVVATLDDAASYVCKNWIDEVLVCPSEHGLQPKDFLEKCAEMGVTVHLLVNIDGVDKSKQFVEEIGGRTVLTTAYCFATPLQMILKRIFDIIGGLVGSIFALLIGVVIGPVIYSQSKGPIIFKQNRIGKNGKIFQIYKFRSMYLDAEERKKELSQKNRNKDGMMFKLDFDPRVIGNRILEDGTQKTGIGEFIRRTSLDEFPQFFNVLKGEMSLVGTRPPTVDEWEKYEYHHRARLAVKPGITGMWQISGRSDITDFEEVVKLDTSYIKNFSLGMDCKILLKTFLVLFKGKGAY